MTNDVDVTGSTAPTEAVTKAANHVQKFLAPLTVDPTVHGLARILIKRAKEEPELAKLFMSVQQELGDGRDLLDERQSAILDRIRTSDELDLPSAPDWLRPAITAAYLRAKANLTPRVAATILEDPAKALRRARTAARALEPEFMGELIIETTLAAQRDERLRADLHAATDELRPIVADLYRDAPAKAIARAANTGGNGSCRACRGGRCEPISCWVIVIIIVIVIVTK